MSIINLNLNYVIYPLIYIVIGIVVYEIIKNLILKAGLS